MQKARKSDSEKKLNNRKTSYIGTFCLLLLILLAVITNKLLVEEMNSDGIQEGIAREIIRFHVIANSDSEQDQILKNKVKDALVKALSPKLSATNNIDEARALLTEELPNIESITKEVLATNGYSYPVSASLKSSYFPMKMYGQFTFPPGNYEALRVQIGEAVGQNWWCIMFPPLCLVDETYSIVPESSDNQLRYLLTEEAYESLRQQKVPVRIKFKLFHSIKKLFTS